MPVTGFAKDNIHPAPLHIKINKTKSTQSKSTFNIRVGKTPETTIAKEEQIEDIIHEETEKKATPTNNIEPSALANITPKLIETRACHEMTAEKTNRYKKLADSLRGYLKSQKRDPSLINDIYNASITTQTDFELLIITTMIESDIGRVTKATNSSARGIFQYIEPTWINLMKRYSARIGQPDYPSIIESNTDTNNQKTSKDGQFTKNEILALRNDTKIASLIKANQLKDDAKILTKYKGGQRINATDHYIMHMLGISQARSFYTLLRSKSGDILADSNNQSFREAVRLNPYFFYDTQKNALNATQAYTQFHRKISQQYKKLHMISKKYGKDGAVSSRCHLPNIQTVSTKPHNGKDKNTL